MKILQEHRYWYSRVLVPGLCCALLLVLINKYLALPVFCHPKIDMIWPKYVVFTYFTINHKPTMSNSKHTKECVNEQEPHKNYSLVYCQTFSNWHLWKFLETAQKLKPQTGQQISKLNSLQQGTFLLTETHCYNLHFWESPKKEFLIPFIQNLITHPKFWLFVINIFT